MSNITIVSRTALAMALAGGLSAAAAAQTAPTGTEDPAPAVAAAQTDAPDETTSDIIVTGTRVQGITVAESAAPIKLVTSEAITHVGQPNLNQVLTQLVPSFTAQAFGSDAANLTLAAALRGLNPNQTLVLLNGKRRHGTANLQVLSSPFQGGAAPDLDFITPASIDHIEVLTDGASAQYGSDAIAGVINIIQKKKAGGVIQATGGQYYKSDGETASTSINYGVADDRGYFNATAFYRFHNFSQRGKEDIRVLDPMTGQVNATGALADDYRAMPGFPNVNRIIGDARSQFAVGSYNAGFDMSDTLSFYTFGTVGYRKAEAYENTRLPNRIVRTGVLGVDPGTVSSAVYNATLATNPDYIYSRDGIRPQEAFRELDYAFTAGSKYASGDWTADLSTTFGADQARVHTLNSANRALFIDTGSTPSDFYDGKFENTEWTSNLDVTRKFADFALLAAGAEYRENHYSISPGEPLSYYKTGAQSFPGYSPAAAGRHGRHNYAFYGDLNLTPVDGLKIDGAVRYENYSDFGSKTTWKATGRYDFNEMIAIRGTASSGFRAPTLAESYYTQVNVSPNSAFVQIAANSPSAKILGIPDLKPETSRNYSAGIVLRPVPRLTITVDAFQIRLRNRIVGSSQINSLSVGDAVFNSVAASGYVLESFANSGIVAFVNGPTTRTRGVDLTAAYDANFGSAGKASFTVSGAYNKTKLHDAGRNTAEIAGLGQTLFDASQQSYLTTATPHLKLIGGVNWSLGRFLLTARETYYSRTRAILNDGGGLLTPTRIKPAGITDLELGYKLTERLTVSAGANNLFDKEPQKEPYLADFGETAGGGVIYRQPLTYSPYGINGGYYYARVEFKL